MERPLQCEGVLRRRGRRSDPHGETTPIRSRCSKRHPIFRKPRKKLRESLARAPPAVTGTWCFTVSSTRTVLGAQAGGEQSEVYHPSLGDSLTAANTPRAQFQFDRDTRLGYQESLSYQIVVGWVIAEHKSQGLFQTRCRQDRFENFWLFTVNRGSASNESVWLFDKISARAEASVDTGVAVAARTR